MTERRLPPQHAPVAIAEDTSVCASARNVVHRIPEAKRRRRVVAMVVGGALSVAVGAVVLVLGEIPGATGGGDDPRWFGLVAVCLGAVTVWMGWSTRHDDGWAIAPEGVTVSDRTVPWEDIGWVGLVVDTERDEGRTRQLWQLALRDDQYGRVDVSRATRPDPEAVGALCRSVAAAWLVGAPPVHVPFVLAPPDQEPIPELDDLVDAWDTIREGRWAQLHDLGRLEGATVLPPELHGAGLEHLDEVVPAPETVLASRPPQRGRRWTVGGIQLPARQRRRGPETSPQTDVHDVAATPTGPGTTDDPRHDPDVDPEQDRWPRP